MEEPTRMNNWTQMAQDLRLASQTTSSGSSTPKVPEIRGTLLAKELWRMSAALDGVHNLDCLVRMIADNLQNTLKQWLSYREDGTFTIAVDQHPSGITVICSEQKKIPEKSGQT